MWWLYNHINAHARCVSIPVPWSLQGESHSFCSSFNIKTGRNCEQYIWGFEAWGSFWKRKHHQESNSTSHSPVSSSSMDPRGMVCSLILFVSVAMHVPMTICIFEIRSPEFSHRILESLSVEFAFIHISSALFHWEVNVYSCDWKKINSRC